MTVDKVNSATFITDIIILLRNKLLEAIEDPIMRAPNEHFVMTSYPRNNVNYPIITITDSGTKQEGKLGMGSQGTILRLGIEIRIWARNIKERDELFNKVYDYLRTNQIEDDKLVNANLHDFSMDNVVNVSEDSVKSKIGEFTYLFLCI